MRAAAEAEHQMLATLAAWTEAWDAFDALASPDYQRRAPDQNADSLEEFKAFVAQIHTVYPDFNISNDGSAAGPDGGFLQWTVTGTDSGSEGATGNALKATGISRFQFVDGKIASELVIFDTGTMLNQLDREELPTATR